MSSDKKNAGAHLVPVTIYGHTYSLRADDDPGYVERLAGYVDKRVREVAKRTRTADTTKLFVLAALNIADELHQLELESKQDSRGMDSRAERIESLLDQALAGPS
jgi:cell division protein ZapA